MTYSLITGASSGIGLCYAEQLASQGHNIILVSNREQENNTIAHRLMQQHGIRAVAIYADLSEQGAAEKIYRQCMEQGLEVDILINNAGILLFSQLRNTSEEQLRQITTLHCVTPTLLCRLFGEQMCRRGNGQILLTSSITAWTPYPTISHYAASKAYIKTFGEAIHWEMRQCGVKLTTIFPSAVDTPLYNLSDKMRRRLLRWGVMMTPQDVARRGLRALSKGRRKCLPGILTTIEAGICAALPGWVLRPILRIPAVRRILESV